MAALQTATTLHYYCIVVRLLKISAAEIAQNYKNRISFVEFFLAPGVSRLIACMVPTQNNQGGEGLTLFDYNGV